MTPYVSEFSGSLFISVKTEQLHSEGQQPVGSGFNLVQCSARDKQMLWDKACHFLLVTLYFAGAFILY